MSADAYHMTAPDMNGPRRCMLAALRSARVNADEIQYLNAHGTSTPLGDINETKAIKAALGDAAHHLVVNSTKSMTGHLFNQDPECDLDYCANTARDMRIDVALKNSFGFGGTNGTLVFKRI
jgi:3-oxoacyl-[acyl-carrier-protein] synthase II